MDSCFGLVGPHQHGTAKSRAHRSHRLNINLLSYYKPGEPLEVQCDSSQAGLGAALMQGGHPIAYASRALTETESRYVQMEKEMLAIVFAVEKSNDYTFGNKTIVFSDHKPLESILKKPLHRAPSVCKA